MVQFSKTAVVVVVAADTKPPIKCFLTYRATKVEFSLYFQIFHFKHKGIPQCLTKGLIFVYGQQCSRCTYVPVHTASYSKTPES